MHHAGRRLLLADLQARIAHLERGSRRPCETLRFGIPALDAHLPAHGLPLGLLHEIVEDGAGACHAATARLFVAGILARLNGPVLWCLARRDLFAPGLASVGLDPNRVIFVETVREADVLPAMEEGLRHCGLAAVVGELARLRFTPSRRLQLAAEASGVTAFALRRWREGAGLEATCSTTRWRVGPAPSSPLPAPGLGRARWRVELVRCRGAEPRSWLMEACDEEGRLALPPNLAHRPRPQAERAPRAAAG